MQGALGVNTSLFAFSFVVFNFLSNATTPLVAAALAAGDKPQVGRIFMPHHCCPASCMEPGHRVKGRNAGIQLHVSRPCAAHCPALQP